MKRKAIIPLVLGLGIGLLTVKLAVDAIKKAQAAGENRQTIHAVRAREDIGAYQEITAEMVEIIETAESNMTPVHERIDSLKTVLGRVTSKSIPQYSAVLNSMLAPEGTLSGMVGRIPPGYRAVAVKITEDSSVAYQIRPGDYVDVIVVMDIESAVRGGRRETIAEVILQHVELAAIGNTTGQQGSAGGSSKMKPARSATLLVPEEEVPKLHLAATRGKITLAMRGKDDGTMEDPPVAYGTELFGPRRGQKPKVQETANVKKNWTPPPVEMVAFEPHSVIVYRGSVGQKGREASDVERITFAHASSSQIIDFSLGPPTRASSALEKRSRTRRTTGSDLRSKRNRVQSTDNG